MSVRRSRRVAAVAINTRVRPLYYSLPGILLQKRRPAVHCSMFYCGIAVRGSSRTCWVSLGANAARVG